MDAAALAGLNPFGILDVEAGRLDHFFGSLDSAGWARPSRCAGWSVQDVLAHLAGAELYNHACLDNDLASFRAMVRDAGITGGVNEYNAWCVRQRRGLPAAEVLAEWREANGETRHRMAALDRDAPLMTAAGPYPAGLQALHYSSDLATHADDIGAPVAVEEEPGRTAWRASFGRYALAEQNSPATVTPCGPALAVQLGQLTVQLSPEDFVEATVGRLAEDGSLDPTLRDALRCLA
jgi:uncharacterized protein (TIGR03083 family)